MTYVEFKALYQKYTVNPRVPAGQDTFQLDIQEDGFLEMAEAPTGFMVIKRAVFEKMIQHYPELQYVPDSLGVENAEFYCNQWFY